MINQNTTAKLRRFPFVFLTRHSKVISKVIVLISMVILMQITACKNSSTPMAEVTPVFLATETTLNPTQSVMATLDAQLKGSGVFTVYITGNGVSQIIEPEFINQGTTTWEAANEVALNYRYFKDDSGKTELKNCLPGGVSCYQFSAFACPDWNTDIWKAKHPTEINERRPAYVINTTPSHQTGKFSFFLCNNNDMPSRPQPYIEHFELAEGGSWFDNTGSNAQLRVEVRIFIK